MKQIVTGTISHLDARMIATALEEWRLENLDVLLIENVGNLVCPLSYDLGESMGVVLLAAGEGRTTLKGPTIFNSADVAVITKMDLAKTAELHLRAARVNINVVRPGMQIFEISAKSRSGMNEVLEL